MCTAKETHDTDRIRNRTRKIIQGVRVVVQCCCKGYWRGWKDNSRTVKVPMRIMRENGVPLNQRMAGLDHDSTSEAERSGRSVDLRKIISGMESAHSRETTARSQDNIADYQRLKGGKI